MASALQRLGADLDRLTRDAWRLEPGVVEPFVPKPLAFRRIVLAVDDSKASRMAAAWARELAVVHRARVWAVSVAPHPGTMAYYRSLWGEAALTGPAVGGNGEPQAQRVVDEAVADLQKSGVPAEGVLLHGGAVPELVAFARRNRADLVVLGAHHHEPLDRFLLGSVADGVKDHVAASVLLARTWPLPGHVVVPVDGSRASKRAAAMALRLCKAWKVRATFLHVVRHPDHVEAGALRAQYERAMGELGLTWLEPKPAAAVEVGPAAERIAAVAADRGAGLVVMGSRGLGGLPSLVAGSVSDRVAHTARASVLLVKAYRQGGRATG